MYWSTWAYAEHLTELLKKDQQEVLNIYAGLRAKEGKEYCCSLQSLHNTIGSKNNTFVDSIRTEFINPKDFEAQWIKGLCDSYGDRVYEGANGQYQYIILEIMKYPICRKYIHRFLERNFYRNLKERKRYKPSENLWEVWFGSNPLYWGILISPAYRNDIWTNDVSEIRRADYEYWTIGHILETGIVVPNNPKPFQFSDLQAFINFYEQIVMRLSKSEYEKEIMRRYFEYLKIKSDVENTPLLIPEFRFDNDQIVHKYRLDFTILNPFTRQLIGFEISPQSTHMNIKGIRSKTQIQMNEDIKAQWEKEMAKRNEFFKQYGVTTITFTDSNLQNIDDCFDTIKEYLEMRDVQRTSYEEQEKRLDEILMKCG